VDPADVERRYGIPPKLVPDFIALRGDPSDGLPGAKGVGEKTAAELLRKHGSLEGVLDAAIRETRPKLRTTLLESRDELLAFKEIATLQDAGLKRPPDGPLDRGAAAAAARERGMNRLADRLEK
jgi:DNA polymerase-1